MRKGTLFCGGQKMEFDYQVNAFLMTASAMGLRMLMVGGGAVNFHGYQRHSAEVRFWIDMDEENVGKLLKVFQQMGYAIEALPPKVLNREQNISVKISPLLELELITRFDLGCSFEEAWEQSKAVEVAGYPLARFHVLSKEHLEESKMRSGRPKDLLDIEELQKRGNDAAQ